MVNCLPLVDWSTAGETWSAAWLFGRLRGFVFSAMKQRLWLSALESSSSYVQNKQVRLRSLGWAADPTRCLVLQVTLDNHKAMQAREKAGDDDPLDVIENSMFGQVQLNKHEQVHALLGAERNLLWPTQLYTQLRNFSARYLRSPNNSQPFSVRYKSESGIDAGGLFRDALTQVW